MNTQTKRTLINISIIMAPMILIMLFLSYQMTTLSELGTWDMAISIGAMISVLIFLIRDKGRRN